MSGTARLTLEGRELVDAWLEEQQRLTAVDRFAQRHEAADVPAQQRYYRGLIPLEKPGAGEQYAFEVDLDACTGCKACVTACHNLNGLDVGETWRQVGQLVGPSGASATAAASKDGDGQMPDVSHIVDQIETVAPDAASRQAPAAAEEGDEPGILQHVSTACHHCVDPACLNGCPVNAYEKDPVTGIVRHLDDQCIGCQYCVFKCPYDVPRYNPEKGIVRKCDMCSDRLAEDEAPACAQACPTEAISIRVIQQAAAVAEAEAGRFLPSAPEPGYTKPTTRYRTRRDLNGARAADVHRLEPEHAHLPLVIMLVLTQLSVGGFLVGWLIGAFGGGGLAEPIRPVHATLSLVFGLVALGASTLHLGRPMYAFRAVVGLRTSWLSREIVGFGGFAKLAMGYAAIAWLAPGWLEGSLGIALPALVAVTGVASVFCSVMIYADTRRPFWRLRDTGPKFLLSTAMLGSAVTLLAGGVTAAFSEAVVFVDLMATWGRGLCLALVGLTIVKLAGEASALAALRDRAGADSARWRSARLLVGPLGHVAATRVLVGGFGGIAMPLLLLQSVTTTPIEPAAYITLLLAVFILTLVGELVERYLFFTAVAALKMPGGLHA